LEQLTYCPLCKDAHLQARKQYTFSTPIGTPASRTEELTRIYVDRIARSPTGRSQVTVSYCPRCSLLFTNPRLSKADLDLKYAEVTPFDLAHRSRHGLPPGLAERRRRTTPFLLDLLDRESARILDYGGAEGFLLSPLIDAGHRGYVADYIDYEREDDRIRYLGQGLGEQVSSEAPYDLVLLLHTLEHVTDPVGMLSDLAQLLGDSGKLYVEVPLGAWLEWEHLKEPLTHLNFFSEQSLAEAARRAGLHLHHLSTNWQYVTQPERTPCINMVVGKREDPSFRSGQITPGKQQMHPLYQIGPALRVNARYYGKIAAKSLLS
jgi:2-polyprenyl-3-methyl-5-hydroxy-6-metoxy-1,4-benzoquinol methylase